jgi:hypothetical protein
MKPTLKAPGSQRLKLKYDETLSNFGFNFNLRRYITAAATEINAAASAGNKLDDVDPDGILTLMAGGSVRTSTRLTLSLLLLLLLPRLC